MRPQSVDSRLLMVLAIVILTQYIITTWVYNYGGNEDVVGYVSFAGTIVAIILAVLAIVYAYYQNFSQQRDSYNIASQVDLLRRVVEEMRDSERSLASEVRQLHELRAKVDESANLTKETRVEASALRAEIKLMLQEKAQAAAQPAPAAPDHYMNDLGDRLVNIATPMQLSIYYAHCLAEDYGVAPMDVDSDIARPVAPEALEDWVAGISYGTFLVAHDVGLLPLNRSRPVFPPFKAKVLEAVGDGLGDSEDSVLNARDIARRFIDLHG